MCRVTAAPGSRSSSAGAATGASAGWAWTGWAWTGAANSSTRAAKIGRVSGIGKAPLSRRECGRTAPRANDECVGYPGSRTRYTRSAVPCAIAACSSSE